MATVGAGSNRPIGLFSRLWVFDFDWTVVNENSDTWIHRCAPGAALPPAVKDSYIPPDWVGYMNRVLAFLAEHGVTADDLRAQLQVIPWTPGMRELLEGIADSGSGTDSSPDPCPHRDPDPTPVTSAPTDAPSAAPRGSGVNAPAGEPDGAARGASVGIRGAANRRTESLAQAAQVTTQTDASWERARPEDSDGAAACDVAGLDLPTAVSPLAAFEEEAEADAGEEKAAVNSSAAAPPSPAPASCRITPGRFRTPQHAVILSDANSLFIPWILDKSVGCSGGNGGGGPAPAGAPARPLSGAFLRILTNPAAVDASTGAVRVAPHNGPTPTSAAPPHACPRCHPNLCKRDALRRLLDEQAAAGVSYRQLVYVGDGRNDLCPCLALRPGDVAMPRVGFALHKLLLQLIVEKTAATATATGAIDMPAATSPAGVAAAANATGAPSGEGVYSGSAVSEERSGDDHVYGAVPHSAGAVKGPQRPSDTAAAAGVAVAAAQALGAGGPGGDEGEPLRAGCVPWVDAYDIIRWVRQQDDLREDG